LKNSVTKILSASTMLLFLNVLVAAARHPTNPGMPSVRDITHGVSHRHRRAQPLMNAASIAVMGDMGGTQPAASHSIDPETFGADPTGIADSSPAFDKVVQALLKLAAGRTTPSGLNDLGGAVINLNGGVYKVSRPIAVPEGYANYRVQGGTLVAAQGFADPSASSLNDVAYLLQLGSNANCTKTSGGGNNKDCTSNVGVQQITIDANAAAGGGLRVQNAMDVNVGPAVYVIGFNKIGISLAGCGAGYIHEAWLGQFPPGDPAPRTTATATAILLDADEHDCDVVNVIVFSSRVGVNSTNSANRLQGVHTWNLMGSHGGTGILLHGGGGRVEQCYLDYAPLTIRIGAGWSAHGWFPNGGTLTMVEGNLFLGSSTIVLQAADPLSTVHGLIVQGNTFHTTNTPNTTFVLDQTDGTFVGVVDTIVENNEAGKLVEHQCKHGKLSTRATQTVAVPVGVTQVALNFSDALLFGTHVGIAEESITCNMHGSFATALASAVLGGGALGVTVTLKEAMPPALPGTPNSTATITCTVDQSTRSCPAH